MIKVIRQFRCAAVSRWMVGTVLASFMVSLPGPGYGQSFLNLPRPGAMIQPSPLFEPPLIKGIVIHPENGLRFDFLIDPGNKEFQRQTQTVKNKEYQKLIKYFIAALTVPEKDLWVNLSPYEKNRMIPESFAKTEMGRDLLGQDYILKQVTASLMYPEKELGRRFWDKIYKEAKAKFGTEDIPVDTFNKVWIIPDRASVYEHGNAVFLVESHLKVMLEEDYVALEKHSGIAGRAPARGAPTGDDTAGGVAPLVGTRGETTHNLASQIVREVIIPAIEKEVNEGKNFALLRQINDSLILAIWYKKVLKESLLGKIYIDQAKTQGVHQPDFRDNEKIYNQYVEAFKQGVFNYLKEETDPVTEETVSRTYFSGGYTAAQSSPVIKAVALSSAALLRWAETPMNIEVVLEGAGPTSTKSNSSPAVDQEDYKTRKAQAQQAIDAAQVVLEDTVKKFEEQIKWAGNGKIKVLAEDWEIRGKYSIVSGGLPIAGVIDSGNIVHLENVVNSVLWYFGFKNEPAVYMGRVQDKYQWATPPPTFIRELAECLPIRSGMNDERAKKALSFLLNYFKDRGWMIADFVDYEFNLYDLNAKEILRRVRYGQHSGLGAVWHGPGEIPESIKRLAKVFGDFEEAQAALKAIEDEKWDITITEADVAEAVLAQAQRSADRSLANPEGPNDQAVKDYMLLDEQGRNKIFDEQYAAYHSLNRFLAWKERKAVVVLLLRYLAEEIAETKHVTPEISARSAVLRAFSRQAARQVSGLPGLSAKEEKFKFLRGQAEQIRKEAMYRAWAEQAINGSSHGEAAGAHPEQSVSAAQQGAESGQNPGAVAGQAVGAVPEQANPDAAAGQSVGPAPAGQDGKALINDLEEILDIGPSAEAPNSEPGRVAATPVGGIDLQSASSALQIKRDKNGAPLPVQFQDIPNIRIEGLTPVIIHSSPVPAQNLRLLLGFKDAASATALQS
ncbi:MAG: hypothetical protein HQL23_03900 [Candidatus Omnitrophica bacterium]|nr:hypothetical protein [Candidatus Omnitrophota bacterium]